VSGVLEIPGFPKPTSCRITTAHNPVPLRFVLHHVQPAEAGGPTVAENLADVCDSCHYSAHRVMWEMAKGLPVEKVHRNILKLAKTGYDACVAAGTVDKIPNEG
jgi:hypothetical protein